MTTITLTAKETIFLNAYLEAIDFTETGGLDQPDYGTDLDPDFMRESIIDCLAFYSRIQCYLSDDNIEQAGHDFWLTRNGNGSGFWNRPKVYGERLAAKFSTIASSFGEVYAIYETEVTA